MSAAGRKEDPFFLVWTPSCPRSPQFRHASRARADSEAERLAKKYPGCAFYVLAAVGRRMQPPMVREQLLTQADIDRLELEDDIPF